MEYYYTSYIVFIVIVALGLLHKTKLYQISNNGIVIFFRTVPEVVPTGSSCSKFIS